MRLYSCPACAETVPVDSSLCPQGHPLRYALSLDAMQTDALPCANADVIGCTWAAPEEGALCPACALTEVIPDASDPEVRRNWSRFEAAKRHVLIGLVRWGWLDSNDTGPRPVFRMLSERQTKKGKVIMGHASGAITLKLSEADDAVREARRANLGEAYRTLTGHLRHELAHYLHWRLADESPDFLPRFREVFGDEREDYAEALEAHYASDTAHDPAHITPYAGAHPHEDWAETVAHILHLVDVADSAAATGLGPAGGPAPGSDPYTETDGAKLVTEAAEVGLAVNHVNRSMGLPDLYPFVLSDMVRSKLVFAHNWLRRGGLSG